MSGSLFTLPRPATVPLPPGASPLLASILLGVELCTTLQQLSAWWDWPPHREARWHLSAEEQRLAADGLERRCTALMRKP